MITFFRRIRQKMFSENKFIRYLIYAVGEILLVVIGILIALQVNNWNEQRKARILERTYLIDVHQEFKSNKEKFISTVDEFVGQYQLADSLARKVFPITNDNWSQIFTIYGNAFNPTTFDPSNSSIDVLINSGQIDLVQNDTLKKYLLSWHDQFGDYKEDEDRLQKWWDVFNEIYLEEPSYNVRGANRLQGRKITNITDELKIKLEKLMWKRRADLGLITSRWSINQESKELMESIDNIIRLTEPFID